MNQPGYKQFCPVAMAAEILCTRWTMVLMRELVAGSTRFNDLRRGVPEDVARRFCPSASRSWRLPASSSAASCKSREGHLRIPPDRSRARICAPVVEAMGFWGQKWVEARAVAARISIRRC